MSLVESQESSRIRTYLNQRPSTEELPRAQIFRERSEDFRKNYVEFIGQVNARNHSLHWWTMPFTNKNPLATPLCRNISDFLLIVGLIRSGLEALVVVTDSRDLAAQVGVWGKAEGIRTINAVKKRSTWESVVKGYTPGAVLFAFVKTMLIWVQVRRYRLPKDTQSKYTVVASLLHTRSLAETGKYHDVYFGRLVDEMPEAGTKAIVFGSFQERWRDQLPRLKSLRSGPPVVPMEAYLTLGNLVWCGLRALVAFFSPSRMHGPAEIDGVDARYLVKRAIRDARRSGNLFMTLKVYHCARQLGRKIQVSRCLYPYENRAWERMLILGIRSASPDTRMVGYQHASITPGHTNFILGSAESGIIPLPDRIVTTGPLVMEWLEKNGNYPSGVFRSACALRQQRDGSAKATKRGQRLNKVLVALATSLEEYIGSLVVLEKAFAGSNGYDVRIRPHPAIPLESALEIAPLTRRDFFSASEGSLADALQWADVVLYASSTVGMEAVSLGIPAVYLDLGNFLDTDPMFGWSEFKWTVSEPSELVDAIQDIKAIPEAQFQKRQRLGQQYVDAYLSPVTTSDLRTFMEA